MLLPPWPQYTSEEIKKVTDILSSGKVNYWNGNEGKHFEKEFASWSGCKYAVALANGSLALSAAYKAIGIRPGDEIITTPRTFIATSSTLVLLGAKSIFADVDRNSGSITANTIAPLINKKTKAISVVHLGGWPADMVAICDLAASRGIAVIEDCSQAHGASIEHNGLNRPVGSFGDISTWSFCLDKIISTGGEGGMVTTNNHEYWKNIWSFKDHGKNLLIQENSKPSANFRWLHDNFGTNYRLTEIQSALGRIQLRGISETTLLRKRNALLLAEMIKDIPTVRVPLPSSDINAAWYKFYCFINKEALKTGWDRDRILSEMKTEKLPSFSGSCSEIYLEKCFKSSGLTPKARLPIAKELGETSLMFLVHPTISIDVMEEYATRISSILKKSSR